MQRVKTASKRGDTLIEVVLALTIFSSLAVMAINTMNAGIYQAERSVEITMARNEIDAQAEAIRFIQNNYVAEREYPENKQQYSAIWKKIISNYTINAADFRSSDYDINASGIKTCNDAYTKQFGDRSSPTKKVFAINTRLLEPSTGLYEADASGNPRLNASYPYSSLLNEILISKSATVNGKYVLRPASLYPRGIYSVLDLGQIKDTNISSGVHTNSEESLSETEIYRKAQGIEGTWVLAVKGDNSSVVRSTRNAEFFDFYIRTCWQAVGLDAPSTLTTIVRLYNPEVIE